MRICLATNNRHKIEEVSAILGSSFPLLSLAEIGCLEELPEEQRTIAGNALQKAQYVFDHYHIAAISDDSGLEVESLAGEPGVDSAYYAGPQRNAEDNIELLLKKLYGKSNRRALFRTVITLILPSGDNHQFIGTLNGVILEQRQGNGGFGYDPVFMPDGFSMTLAEMTPAEKNSISHRSVAVKKLIAFLRAETAV